MPEQFLHTWGNRKHYKHTQLALKLVQRVGYKTGFLKGLNQGCINLINFGCYGLLIWLAVTLLNIIMRMEERS